MSLYERQKTEDIWLKDKDDNCFYLPEGWNDDSLEEGEVCGYYPTHTKKNSPVEVGYIPESDLLDLEDTTEQEARQIHPAMRILLDNIELSHDEYLKLLE